MDSWQKDLSASAYDFQHIVWPVIAPALGGGNLRPVEAVETKEFQRSLDMLAGIDAWQVVENVGIRGIASRVQWGDFAWDTFTIRESRDSGATTELEKRLAVHQGEDGWLLPAFYVHAYLTEPRGRLLSAAAIRTSDLYDYLIALGRNRWPLRRTNNARFVWVKWDSLENAGYEVIKAMAPAEVWLT